MKNIIVESKNEKRYQDIKFLNNIIRKLSKDIQLSNTEKTFLIINYTGVAEDMAENNLNSTKVINIRNKMIDSLIDSLKLSDVKLKDVELEEFKNHLCNYNIK